MAQVVIYTTDYCSFCARAKALLRSKGVSFEEIDLSRRLKRLARRRGRTIVILRHHPILTSGRKARLYTPREALTFMLKTIVQRGRTLRSARECYQWYDGRR